MAYFQIFNLTIPSIWLAVVMASFAATILYKFATTEKVTEWFGNALFIYILVWKFSYILFHFSNFLNMPLSAIYFNGGIKGHWLAVFVMALYVMLLAQKKYSQVAWQIPSVLILYIVNLEIFYDLLNKDLTFAIIQSGLLIIIFILLTIYKQLHMQTILLLFAIELMILSLQHTLSLTKLLTYSSLIAIAFIARRREKINVKK